MQASDETDPELLLAFPSGQLEQAATVSRSTGCIQCTHESEASAASRRPGAGQSGQDDGLSTQINRQRSYFGPVDIERLEIKLLDEYGRIIDLNNMDWYVALTMECLYEN